MLSAFLIWQVEGRALPSLVQAMRCAGCEAAKRRLAEEPIKASWAHATDVLLGQYNEAIEANMPRRKELHSVTHALTHLFKAVLFCLTVYLILRSYTRKVLKPSVLKMYKFGFWMLDDLLDMARRPSRCPAPASFRPPGPRPPRAERHPLIRAAGCVAAGA